METFIVAQTLTLIKEGHTYCRIATKIGISSSAVSAIAVKAGIHKKPRKEVINSIEAKCSRCGNVCKIIRGSFCGQCKQKALNVAQNKDIVQFFGVRLRKTRARAKELGLPCNLGAEYLEKLWNNQHGLCFYSEEHMSCQAGEGQKRNVVSIDRIIPENGYTIGNVVLCTQRMNAIKQDLTLHELARWMPEWHRKLMEYLSHPVA